MQHNLFTHPNEYTVKINDTGYEITNAIESKTILNILKSIGYDTNEILNQLKNKLANACFITPIKSAKNQKYMYKFLKQNGYLRTTN